MAQWGQIQAQGAASLPRCKRSEGEAVRGILRGHVPYFPGVLRKPFFYLPDFAQEKVGSSTDFSVYLLAITNAATFPSRFISAMAARSIGPLNTLSICVGASTVVLLSWIGVSSLPGLDVWAIFWGFTAGPLVTIPAAVVPQLSPSPGVVGTRMGMIWLCAAMGECIYQPRSRVI